MTVYQLNTTGHVTTSVRLYNDATIAYFGPKHLPYAILALTVLLLFAVLPTLLLIIYPFRWFQKLLNLFPIRWHILHTFVDSFHGCYKDGTEPSSSDCRWFASVLFLTRYAMLLIAVNTFDPVYYPLATMVSVIAAILFVTVQPFKQHVNHFTCTFLFLLAMFCICVVGDIMSPHLGITQLPFLAMTVVVGILPLLYISSLSLHWIYSHQTIGTKILRRLQAWRHGYELLGY